MHPSISERCAGQPLATRSSALSVWKRRVTIALLLVAVTATANGSARAQEANGFADLSLADLLDLNVLSVNALGTHTHLEGEWMIGYKYMNMSMAGNRDGTHEVSTDAVLENFMVTPTDMRMQMQMVEVMYAPSNDFTLMVMLPYQRLSMNHLTRMGARFETESEGVGDLALEALYTFAGDVMRGDHRALFSAQASLPTGSIDEFGDTPAGDDLQLPYPMQLGSGTVDVSSAVTYLGEVDQSAWMLQARGTKRIGTNGRDYALWEELKLTGWAAWAPLPWLSPSLQLGARIWGNIDGADPNLNPAMVPTADPRLRGGSRLDISPGLSIYAPSGGLEGLRLSARLDLPLFQTLDGPQLKTEWGLQAGLAWTFK